MYAFRVTDEAEFSAHYDARLSFAPAAAVSLAPNAPFTPSARYAQQSQRPRGGAMLASALAVGALFSAMVWMNVAPHAKREHHIVTMDLTAPPPPSQPESKPVVKTVDMPQLPQAVAQPQPDAPTPPLAVAIAVGQEAAAQPPAPPAPPAPSPVAVAAPTAPAGPAEVGDLGARILSFTPPTYPLESRRNMEEGTVTLGLLVGTDGRVAEISVTNSSGFPRLDKAALEAVRKWRWTPMMRGGEAVMLRGFLKIPFGLRK